MPTYEYECDACEHRFDEFQSMKDDPLTKCPACGKKKLRRLFGTGAAILFKGSGFYETDYRSDSYKKAEKAEKDSAKPADAAASSSDGGKSDKVDKGGTPAPAKADGAATKAGKKTKSKD